MILVDSSLYIDWLRRRVEPHRRLEPWLRSGEVCGCGVVRAEVLRGVVDPAQKSRIEEFFELLPEVPCDAELWREAANLAWRLDRQGKVLPLTDIVIAACAFRAGATLISTDPHFGEIPDLRWQERL